MRLSRKLLSLFALTTVAAGCRDASGPDAAASALAARGPVAPSSGSPTFVVFPNNTGKFYLGQHRIYFARNAICDPATSSYGPGTWDQPCAVAPGPVTITATWWTDEAGNPRIDFQPALRFNPISEVQLE